MYYTTRSNFVRKGVCPCPVAIYMYIVFEKKNRYQVSVYRTTGPLDYNHSKILTKVL